MKYLYLVVEQLNGKILIPDILPKFEFSFHSLRHHVPESKEPRAIIVYSVDPSERLKTLCWLESAELRIIELCRNYPNTTPNYDSKLNILVEKIVLLRDFDPDRECVYMDLDTEIVGDFSSLLTDKAALNCTEYPLVSPPARNLDRVLPFLPYKNWDVRWNPNYKMCNAGFVFIPKAIRKDLCVKALHIVDFLNNGTFPGVDRICNGLDEQIALSIVLQDRFGDTLIQVPQYINHFWLQSILRAQGEEHIKWWLKSAD
jgi:hypothetical protein